MQKLFMVLELTSPQLRAASLVVPVTQEYVYNGLFILCPDT
jgi:hypothetical protein